MKRRHLTLLAVAALFLTPFIAALVLNRLGWHPDATRNNGELITPPLALPGLVLVDRDGGELPLSNLDHRWTVLVRVPSPCDAACVARLDELHRVRLSLGRHAPKLAIRVLVAGEPPALPESLRALDEATREELERRAPILAQSPAFTSFLVDDKAYLMMRFPPELEARLIRRDLGRLIK